MFKFLKRSSKKAGASPGTIVHVGEKKAEHARIRIIDYDVSQVRELEVENVEECFPFKEEPTITWINIDGLHEVEIIEKIGQRFDLHPLVLEDIVHTGQRPKVEDYENHLFAVLKMLYFDEEFKEIEAEQFSLILGPNFVISFQERPGDVFNGVRERIRKGKGRIRKMGADYLAYALMDAIVDNYFNILEKLGESIETLEDHLLADPGPETVASLHELKREMLFLRKSVWPVREVVGGMQRGESPIIQAATLIYLRDLYDHTIQVIDTIETFRDMVSGMFDTYLSSLSNKMNTVMKTLTIIATIFIPLTFLAGLYGMNFEYMPELKWKWSYPLLLAVMALVGAYMISFFKRKKWL